MVTTARDAETNAVLTTRIGNREIPNVLQWPAPADNTVTDIASGQTRITSYTYAKLRTWQRQGAALWKGC